LHDFSVLPGMSAVVKSYDRGAGTGHSQPVHISEEVRSHL
jgi:hypothetical protein